jgi:hypothetical protein
MASGRIAVAPEQPALSRPQAAGHLALLKVMRLSCYRLLDFLKISAMAALIAAMSRRS